MIGAFPVTSARRSVSMRRRAYRCRNPDGGVALFIFMELLMIVAPKSETLSYRARILALHI
jgi:hypothetical protein